MGILGVSLNLRFVFFGRINYRMVFAALALPLMISGCASMRGYPDRLIEPDVALNEVRPIFKRENIEACNQKKDTSCRNSILSAGMIGVDINFSEFERRLFKEKREGSFLTTVTTLGLTTAGAMTGIAALSGIATGIVGSKDAFDKEILLDQAANAIHTQMRALRQTVANRIRYGMKQEFKEYPLDAALIDIEEYYNAGTLLGAFVGITSSAGLKVEESEVNKDRISKGEEPKNFSSLIGGESVKQPESGAKDEKHQDGLSSGGDVTSKESHHFKKTNTAEIIKKWLLNDDDDNTRYNELQGWLKKKNIMDGAGYPETPEFFAKYPNHEEQRKMAIEDLKITQ